MASEWEESTLGNFAPFTYGKSLPARKRNENGIYKVYGSGGISGKHDEPLVNEPGIIIGRKGTVGSIQFSDKPFWPIDTVFYVIDAPERDLHFTYYLLQTLNLDQMNSDSAVPGLNRDTAHSVKIRIPSKKQQIKIASILKAFDNKIELNKKINQTLEQMAQAMFKSWFVDFDPVFDNLLEKHNNNFEKASAYLTNKGAKDLIPKLQQRHQVQQTSDYKPLPDHIKKEFPNDFQHQEDMGWIPEGWVVSPLTKLIEVNPKLKLSKGKIAKYADMKSLPISGYIADNIITKEYKGGAKFELKDVLLARITPCLENGKTAVVDFLNKDEVGFGSTEFIVLRGKDSITMPFVACLARHENFREHCIQNMVGSSGRQRVQNSCFDNFFLAIPKSEKGLINFHKLAEPMFIKMSTLSNSMRDLNNLKDTLLPKLINGELSVRN